MTTVSLSLGSRLDLTARQGTTWRLSLTVTAGTPAQAVNLTGASALLQVRPVHADDDVALPVLEATEAAGLTLGGVAGTIVWRVEADDTLIPYGSYVWECKVTAGDTVALLAGTLTVTPDTAREVAA